MHVWFTTNSTRCFRPSDDSIEASKSGAISFMKQRTTELLEFQSDSECDDDERMKICKVVVLGEQSILKTQLVSLYSERIVSIHLEVDKQKHSLRGKSLIH